MEKEKLKEIDSIFKELKDNYESLKEIKMKECIENYYKKNKKFFNIKIKKTKHNEFEIQNQNILKKGDEDTNINTNNKNLNNWQITEISNNINNKIINTTKLIEQNTKKFIESLKKDYLSFYNETIQKLDNFYRDIKVPCEKYNEHAVVQFQNLIYDIYRRNGCLDKLKDLLSLFDSKNNKGKDALFNRTIFY